MPNLYFHINHILPPRWPHAIVRSACYLVTLTPLKTSVQFSRRWPFTTVNNAGQQKGLISTEQSFLCWRWHLKALGWVWGSCNWTQPECDRAISMHAAADVILVSHRSCHKDRGHTVFIFVLFCQLKIQSGILTLKPLWYGAFEMLKGGLKGKMFN